MINREERVFLGLGSNLGDRANYIRNGLAQLEEVEGVSLERISNVYETDPVGNYDQNKFLNCVVQVRTCLSAQQLLQEIKTIETEQDRKANTHWKPRTLDIDILYFGHDHIKSSDLVVPHPEADKRRFVMVPLCELSPNFIPDDSGETIRVMLEKCKDESAVEPFAGPEFIR